MSIITKFKKWIYKKSRQISYIETQVANIDFKTKSIFLEDKILNSTKRGISEEKYCDHEVIISLASYGKRIREVALTIETLMQQTMLPNRIILNLDPSEKDNPLPLSLRNQIKRGLSINYTNEEIRSYKKLIPALEQFPDAIIITVDDDVLYNYDVIERLYESYIKHPNEVSALRVHTMKFDESGKLASYDKWDWGKVTTGNSKHMFPTGVGGILYPPCIFSPEVFNRKKFMKLCPTADDVWFHAMALKNGKSFVKAESRSPTGEDYIINMRVQDIALSNVNTGEMALNDKQIQAVYDQYGIYHIIAS